ncbi:MAG TPA: GNAT family N-acetyltransferase [Caulobacteraceae bacterium]|nr:GNAT family N-acetyltransferase [Caulobacteraceae bacterium]
MHDHLNAHFGYLARSIAGGSASRRPWGLVVDSGLDCDTFNVVVSDEAAAAPSRREASAAVDGFGGRAFSWWVGPEAPQELATRLVETGLAPSRPEPAMSLDLAQAPGGTAPDALHIARVSTSSELAAYARLLAGLWSPPDANVVRFYETAMPAALSPAAPLVLLLGMAGGEAVATAEVTLGADGVAGLYNVATVAERRRLGFGAAMTAAAISTAKACGMRRLELQSSDDGLRVYERAGFRRFGDWTEFQLPWR